jgi:hypothetical protein
MINRPIKNRVIKRFDLFCFVVSFNKNKQIFKNWFDIIYYSGVCVSVKLKSFGHSSGFITKFIENFVFGKTNTTTSLGECPKH